MAVLCHPDLLYIWLLSFDELRLAMNACLPMVKLHMYYSPGVSLRVHFLLHCSAPKALSVVLHSRA